MKIKRIGMLGYGTVGKGLVQVISSLKDEIKKKEGLEFIFKKIVIKNREKVRNTNNKPPCPLTFEPSEVISDDIDIVVELTGDVELSKKIITDAFRNGKDVITANKALLGSYGKEIFEMASRYFGFKAAVTGCHYFMDFISIARLTGNRIRRMYGILNGTCNFILNSMEDNNMEFEEALAQAQRLGYAEADPKLDLDGTDTAQKISLMAALAYGYDIKYTDFYFEGIEKIEKVDINFAKELDYKIKLLAIVEKVNGDFFYDRIDIRAHPCLVPRNSVLSSAKGNYNAFQLEDDYGVTPVLVAPGAGANPTAIAVLTDIINASKDMKPLLPVYSENFSLVDINEIRSKYYIRLNVLDQVGVFAKIANILAEHNISISSVIQKAEGKEVVPIIITTHEAAEKDVQTSLQKIRVLNFVKSEPLLIRIFDRGLG